METLVENLADAGHILFHEGVLDAFGHVSARHPDGDRFLMSRSMAPAQAGPDDILTFGLDGEPIEAHGHKVFLERYIHAALYRARPEIRAVVHSHAPALIPFGVVRGATLRPICHMSGFLARGAPVFDIAEAAGDGSDMLIRDNRLGDALAARMGDATVVLMRGHGVTVAADSLEKAVYCAVYAQVNARLVLDSVRLGGEIRYLTVAEALAAERANDSQIGRAWDLWRRAARQATAVFREPSNA
ncbi:MULTISPECIES: class II aldolase/adducin family protein [Cupriavidus]|uniref:class II aldolase/adducin family protein n=1 Tax=Cupriavidus sp. DF5525 TaxID=3160989 RepID=UPI0003B0176E|nr:hypothetical protein N234_30825 [Ralstonia pickettii DTP0602]